VIDKQAVMKEQKAKEERTCGLSAVSFVVLFVVAISFARAGFAEDWPTYLHDNGRSGTTTEQLGLPLVQDWVRTTHRGPRPAWTETPALQNFWGGTFGHKSRMPRDNAFRVVVAADCVYFGSSNSDKLVCLDARDGSELWHFFADGPIRFAPAVYDSKVYFGSDDGYVYCLTAADGSFVWKSKATTSSELMFANGRMVSVCPVRTAVLVDDGVAYWGAGLFAGAQTGLDRYICACNADNGSEIWKRSAPKPTQGYPLASTNNLYMPAGKSTPTYYRKSYGSHLGSIGSNSRQGGAYALLSNDSKLFYGPHYSGSGSYVGKYNASTGASESVAWAAGNYLVVAADYSYYSSDTTIAKIRRSDRVIIWNVPSSHPHELILAGDTLFAGGDDEVAAISTSDGSVSWTAPVDGRVHGLAVANGGLFVSTDLGTIHRFRTKSPCDLDADADVDLVDFCKFAEQWLKTGCGDCGGADLAGGDGQVGLEDLELFAANWLADE
jgi:outer membrane protein assembly factor BamB